MQPISSTDDTEPITQSNGYVQPMDNINGTDSKLTMTAATKKDKTIEETQEKVVLPVEMACMVPLRALIGKLIHKSHADLMTLTDTLPSMSDVEKKRQILTYTTFMRKQYLKLLVLVKWAESAQDIQMCQNIMAYLANQNKIFQDTVDYLHKIQSGLPAARLRNFDIPTAVDVLTTGTYQQMPTKIKDMLTPTPLTDKEVLEIFRDMNDVIRMRMITTEVLPSPMQNYKIENGRIYFTIQNEFEVALTLMGHSNDRRWWIVSLDMFIEATSAGGAAEDVDITLTDAQKLHLRSNAQKQLVPPFVPEGNTHTSLFFPLVNLYDYLHSCCLNMQLEILFIQSAMLVKTRWMNQLKVQMNPDRTKLTLTYWRGGSPASHWARPQVNSEAHKSTVLEISVSNEHEKQLSKNNMTITVRDELKGLIQKAGIGASVALSDLSASDKPKVLSSLKYPKNLLEVLWDEYSDLHTDIKLLDPGNLNAEQLVLHVTNYHSACIINKFREVLITQKDFLEENGLHLAEAEAPVKLEDGEDVLRPEPTLVVRYRHQRFVSIGADARTGKIKVFETSDGCSEGDVKLRGLEERLNNDPANIARHLLWLRSEVVVREVISLGKQLNLQPYHPSHMNLRQEDLTRLFGDVITQGNTKQKYPSHCVFFRFSQFEDWYFVIATIKNEFKSWLCCINKTYDQNDLTYLDCEQLWKDQFIGKPNANDDTKGTIKRRFEDITETESTLVNDNVKKRRVSVLENNNELSTPHTYSNAIDNLSIDLRYLAKLDSLCRAYITNRKIELQLQAYKGSLNYYMRPLLETLSIMESQIINHPAADKMEVVCVPQKDLLKACAYYYQEGGVKREKPLESIPWIESVLPEMKNDVLIRPSGWWDCGRGECYVVIQDKLDWERIALQGNELGGHIALDKATNVVSFTYPDIDSCIDRFLVDWERVFMMVNITRQVSSVWFEKYKEQLEFSPTDLQELSFVYAKDFTCNIKWNSLGPGKPRQYNIELGITEDTNKASLTSLPSMNSRNPHWRIASFLRDVLNEKRDLIYFIQILFQTLPLMSCLEHLEVKCAQDGNIGKVSIIPRAYDSVRVIFSAIHAIDIRFTDTESICVSDAAYHHLFYSSRTKLGHDTLIAPQPYLVQTVTPSPSYVDGGLNPIKVAQQFKFIPFEQFSILLDTLDSWIFSSQDDDSTNTLIENNRWYASGKPWSTESEEPRAVSFQHGLLCSASLCQGILHKLCT
ncbi:mediator complex subunit MED14-domain-containing protein [Thamnidium elegans]|nr:mediator complex subunit MED14-domain-containing protein [Thamnidium elegans]